ncbi:MAG: carboxylating nicotinate-nucleotide diphosphorylase [Bacteroidetes bacterium]|nr:carboxylating nicotinate-nucleotide diphosphorylase [Bacteroidota bacterium]
MSDFIKLHQKHFNFRQFVVNAFKEDVGDGDHTALSIIPKDHKGWLQLLIKEEGIIAGIEAAELIFKLVDKKIKFKRLVKDGDKVKKGQVAFIVFGNTQKLITSERLILNIMQRMSGIATKTAQLQALCKGTKAKVIDTRKTTPGFRFFEKWAVVIGGGSNHRYGLFDMILIKDNHIDFAGGITDAIDDANSYLKKKKKKLSVEVETRSIDDVKKVLAHGGVKRIMLDNFSPAETLQAVKIISGKFEIESSGGITEKNIAEYAKCGVDFISVGALTHHVKSLDLSLKALKR